MTRPVRTRPTGPRTRGEFGRPECIDLDDSGNIYVGDPGNARIEVFDPMYQIKET